MAQNCDIMIHECTYHETLREKAIEYGHSTARMAGMYARQSQAKMLVLTHFSPRYREKSGGITIEDLVYEAEQGCRNDEKLLASVETKIPIVAARDFMVIKGNKHGFAVDSKLALKRNTAW